MPEDPYTADLFARAASVAEGLDAVLAMLLLAKRVHVESLSLIEPDLARVELSGEAIEQGLASLAEVMTLTPQAHKRTKTKQKDADDEEESAKAGPSTSTFWQALKDFALPPVNAPKGKTK